MSAPAAASAAAAAAPVASPSAVVEVEEDPSMKEQLEDQEAKASVIANFRTALAEHNAKFPDSELVRELADSDRVAYRFLKARKFDIEKAAQLFRDAVAMRAEKNLDGCLKRPCKKGLEYKVVSKHGWHGFDRFGRPIFIKNTGWQNFPALYSTGTLEERSDYNTYMNEYLRQVIVPQANERIGHKYQIDQVVTIVNLRNFGWHCIKSHNYSWVKEIAHVNNVLYPETAGSTWIINAPRVFSMVWGIVKGWLDERTRAKVMILSGDGCKEMRAVLGEEAFKALPKEIGGDCVCMPASEVPQHGDPCMLGHPLSRAFIAHLAARNKEANIKDSYTPVNNDELKDQEELHDEAGVPE